MMDTNPAIHWTKEQVGEWLTKNDLGKYRKTFEEIGIDGRLLFEITEEDLQTELGVNIRLQRRKILLAIEELKNNAVNTISQQLPASPPEEEEVYFEEQQQQQQGQQVEDPEENQMQQQAPPPNTNNQVIRINLEANNIIDNYMLVLKAVEGQLVDNLYVIGTAGAALGRHSASNDIVISESFVSRRHCQIRFNTQTCQFLISDLGSTTGTFLMIRKPYKLKQDSMFQMGLSEFRVVNIKYNLQGLAISMDLQIFEGPSKNTSLVVTSQGTTIGRDMSNEFSVREDSQMSGFHAKIFNENGKFMLEDVGSTNRTWLRLSSESEKSEQTPVYINDIIKLGSTVFVVQDPTELQLNESTKNISEENACKICYAREANSAFYPCGHISCEICAYRCTNCPHCRQPKHDVVRLYK